MKIRQIVKTCIKKLLLLLPKNLWPLKSYFFIRNDRLRLLEENRMLTQNPASPYFEQSQRFSSFIESACKYYNRADTENVLYYHAGSGNHGCEALVRTIVSAGGLNGEKTLLMSYRAHEDYIFGLGNVIKNILPSNVSPKEATLLDISKDALALSIGGDNYCYGNCPKTLAEFNRNFTRKGIRTALIGCSIEPEIIDDPDVQKDLDSYSLITARESITYNKLLACGINRNTHLIPDSAFTLETVETPLPKQFIPGKTLGLNVSSLVLDTENGALLMDNVYRLCDYILENTDLSILLLPHVVQPGNDDSAACEEICSHYSSARVFTLENTDCQRLKFVISRCRMLIAARTHASIAAYSTCVPTLVLGYSIKSKGIARDIFGTEENYVIDIHTLTDDSQLLRAFIWLSQHEDEIRRHLQSFMPGYISRAFGLSEQLALLRDSKMPSVLPLADSEKCTGCGSCASICSVNAIKMRVGAGGFLFPHIDYDRCVRCGRCGAVCVRNHDLPQVKPSAVYAAVNRSEEDRLSSSSGGIFIALARDMISRGGTVYGAAMCEDMSVRHMRISSDAKLSQLQGSKYVQSELGECLALTKADLEAGTPVLFSGTPCQISALKQFLGKEYENLLLVDIVCHGAPSPAVFHETLERIEKENSSPVVSVNFRSKEVSWENYRLNYVLENGAVVSRAFTEDDYMMRFIRNEILRPSCFDCPSNNFRSGSDLTLGDYWGGNERHPDFADHKGISILLIKTKTGAASLERISLQLRIENADLAHIIAHNPSITTSASK